MLNCIVVDDEPLARELLKTHISMFPDMNLVASCSNALKAYECLQQNQVDLMFLDIEMPFLKGNKFLKELKVPPAVIITTAHREFAIEGYELDAIDYLLKPITFERFFKSIEKYKKQLAGTTQARNNDVIFLPSNNKHIKLELDKVLFVESQKDYITIHLEDGGDIMIKFSISSFETLVGERFLRLHRSFIVNTQKITSLSKNEVWIGSNEIPVGDSYREKYTLFTDALLAQKNKR